MSDERLRELERCWLESGSAEDELALLRERSRSGALSEARLELAAYLGHPSARRLRGPHPFETLRAFAERHDLFRGQTLDELLTHGLQDGLPRLPRYRLHHGDPSILCSIYAWGTEPYVRTLAATLRASIAPWSPLPPSEEALACFEAWVCERTEARRETLEEILWEHNADRSRSDLDLFDDILGFIDQVTRAGDDGELPAHLFSEFSVYDEDCFMRRVGRSEDCLALVRAEVAPWALGLRDPVRDRVAAKTRDGGGGGPTC